MTVALGVMAHDGIIVCADSQYTGEIKTKGPKVFSWDGKNASVIFALCGVIDNATIAIQRCQEVLNESEGRLTVAKTKEIIEPIIKSVKGEYVLSLPPEQRNDADFDLIVGIAAKDEQPSLHYTSSNGDLIKFTDYHYSIGSGQTFAETIMGKFYDSNMGIKDLGVLAAIAIGEAKRYDESCGDATQFAKIKDGISSVTVDFDIPLVEHEISVHERQAMNIFLAACNSDISNESFSRSILDFKLKCELMKKRLTL